MFSFFTNTDFPFFCWIFGLRDLVIKLSGQVSKLSNQLEDVFAEKQKLAEENEELKAELARLKGQSPKPKFTEKTEKNTDISSEKERKKSKKWSKKGKKKLIEVAKEIFCKVSEEILPPDAYYLRRESVISQNLRIVRENIAYQIDVYYSPSTRKLYRGNFPSDKEDYFGSDLQALLIGLHYGAGVTRQKSLEFVRSFGIEISVGSLNNILLQNKSLLVAEQQMILKAGLQTSHQQIDATGSKFKGKNYHTQILCNEFFSVYGTYPTKSRLDILRFLQGGEELNYLYNDQSKDLLSTLKVGNKYQKQMQSLLLKNETYSEQVLEECLVTLKQKPQIYKHIREALALAYYYEQNDFGPIEILISDNAPEYNLIAEEHALCWIHDVRNYKKLTAYLPENQQILEDFLTQYWSFYQLLLDFQENHAKEKISYIENEFDRIFTTETDYYALNERINKTFDKKEELLKVLKYPYIPLHNNLAELAARYKVRKRDISLHNTSQDGLLVLDAAMSIIDTARKLGINIYQYLTDRIKGSFEMTSLDQLIMEID